ncbi:MAG: polysaccharide deacetylase family protein [Actinobacteria bacterium]|nr:polysaccharide deacetylase family protein [Actinomycetota bacterium]
MTLKKFTGNKLAFLIIGAIAGIVPAAVGIVLAAAGIVNPDSRDPSIPYRNNAKPVTETPIVWKAKTREKAVALTFDDGPDPRFTPKILDILKKNKIKATFFVTGANARKYPELVKREFREDHLIGNHTWSHLHLNRLPLQKVKEEIDLTGDEIARITGYYPIYMRPPYGEMNNRVYKVINERGYRVAIWSTQFQELRYPASQDDADFVASQVKPGSIILGHDGRRSYRVRGVNALPLLISKLKAQGYRFVRIDELLTKSGMISPKSKQPKAQKL